MAGGWKLQPRHRAVLQAIAGGSIAILAACTTQHTGQSTVRTETANLAVRTESTPLLLVSGPEFIIVLALVGLPLALVYLLLQSKNNTPDSDWVSTTEEQTPKEGETETLSTEDEGVTSSAGHPLSTESAPSGGIIGSLMLMVFTLPFLFWIPVLGPFFAGYVGGKIAGGVTRGALAAMPPALFVGTISLQSAPTLVGGTMYVLINTLSLVAGVVVGGVLN